MTVGFQEKTRVINVYVNLWNEAVLDLLQQFADEKGRSQIYALFYFSEGILKYMTKQKEGLEWNR